MSLENKFGMDTRISRRHFMAFTGAVAVVATLPDIAAAQTPSADNLKVDLSGYTGEAEETKNLLDEWQKEPLTDALKSNIMGLAISYFCNQMKFPKEQVAGFKNTVQEMIKFVDGSVLASANESNCGDKERIPQPSSVLWLMDLRGGENGNKLLVNKGFVDTNDMSTYDYFFRYGIGVYTIAAQNEVFAGGVRSADGNIASGQKGLVQIGPSDNSSDPNGLFAQFTKGDGCISKYRYSFEQAFPAAAALEKTKLLGFTPEAPYPESETVKFLKQKVLDPYFGGSTDQLMAAFLTSSTSIFFQQIGNAMGGTDDEQKQKIEKLLDDAYKAFSNNP